jgi:hypothetical protein
LSKHEQSALPNSTFWFFDEKMKQKMKTFITHRQFWTYLGNNGFLSRHVPKNDNKCWIDPTMTMILPNYTNNHKGL